MGCSIPICVSGTEVQLNGLCSGGGGSALAMWLLDVSLVPHSGSRVATDLCSLICFASWNLVLHKKLVHIVSLL